MGTPLEVDLPIKAKRIFTDMDLLARAFRRGNYKLPVLRRITNDNDSLTLEQHMYIADDPAALGVTFGDHDKGHFDIWLNPCIRGWETDMARDTILHELCHGYFSCYKHGEQFRRYLGRLMYHYKWLIAPDFSAEIMVQGMVNRYSRSTEEHQDFEVGSLLQAARDEHLYVARRFEELKNAETLVMHGA